MGGRGQTITTVDPETGKKTKLYDLTKTYKGMQLRDFEEKIKNKKVEYVGTISKDGTVLNAGTTNTEGSVTIPNEWLANKNVVGLTHNHPSGRGRMIGGTLSGQDIITSLSNNLDFVRAVATGQNENTYIFRKKQGAKQKKRSMLSFAKKVGSRKFVEGTQRKAIEKVTIDLYKKGKNLPKKRYSQVGLGALKGRWKSPLVESFGYEYIEIKKRW